MQETTVLVGLRDSTTWPRHKQKARKRSAARKKIAREAQTRIDRTRTSK